MSSTSRGMLRIAIAILLLIIGVAAGWVARALLAAPPDVPTVALYDDWRIGCPPLSQKAGACSLVQDVVDAKSHREIAHLSLSATKSGRQLTITVPYDVLLPSGVGLALGKDKVRVYPYTTCDATGCLAQVTAGDDLVEALRSQRDAKLQLAQLDNRAVDLPFSLKGFARAEDAYSTDQARRHNWWARILP